MLDLNGFFHLPEIDTLAEQIAADQPGLVLVAGLDPPSLPDAIRGQFLTSGRTTTFAILARQILAAGRKTRATIVAPSKDALRLPNALRSRVEWALVKPPLTYADRMAEAVRTHPDVIVVDQLNAMTAVPALQAARAGIRVVTQMDCAFYGANVARHLIDLGVPIDHLDGIRYIVSVERQKALCTNCRQPVHIPRESLAPLVRRYSTLDEGAVFYQAGDCEKCGHTGRVGDVMLFDVFHASPTSSDLFSQPSQLAMEEYAARLAGLGYLAWDDIGSRETDRLRVTYSLLTASERALGAANAELEQKTAQLEAANRVLEQRTESLISLQEIAQALTLSERLEDLANRINRRAHQLCFADRSILYVLRPDGMAEVLSVLGWDAGYLHLHLDAARVFGTAGGSASTATSAPFRGYPPGIPARAPDVEGAELHAGLRMPLVAQHEVVGMLIIHSTSKLHFAPGEVAMVEAFANQAAIAIQRTGLIESLRDKITQLQAAQAELIEKERLERELELAREVQQRLLPREFPQLPGYVFAAQSEAAHRVGGDFYDAFIIDDDHLGIVIADVSDKGMPAALFMALTRSLLLAQAQHERSPRAVLTSVHRLLAQLGDPDMFVTMFYGVVHRPTRKMAYVRAGHERPILIRGKTHQFLRGNGTLLGLLGADQLMLTEEEIDLQPGDRLVLYTDGLLDALSPKQEPFGMERLEGFLQQHAHLQVADLCQATFAEIGTFQESEEQFDDMAMLVLGVE